MEHLEKVSGGTSDENIQELLMHYNRFDDPSFNPDLIPGSARGNSCLDGIVVIFKGSDLNLHG